MFHTSIIEISKSALKSNLDFLHKYVNGVPISSVIKGNAYGHGIEHFAPIAEENGIKHFSVFSADEAWRLLQVKQADSTIMIMGMIDDVQIKWAIEHNIQFFVFDIDRLEAAIEAAKELHKPAHVHIEIETGMNRTGFEKDQFKNLMKLLHDHKQHLIFEGLCTHYAGSESIANYVRVQDQLKRYNTARRLFTKNGLIANTYHTACSAASIRYPDTRLDLVRMGILQYGFWPSLEIFIEYTSKSGSKTDPLKSVITWKSRIMSVKKVKMGEFIGYGTSYLASQDMTIATVPIGYSHGFSRGLSNSGRALVRGQRVGVVGLVNMNALTLDVSQLDNVERGDEVVLIGKQGDMSISVSSFSELSDQLNYELLTRLPMNTPRKVVD